MKRYVPVFICLFFGLNLQAQFNPGLDEVSEISCWESHNPAGPSQFPDKSVVPDNYDIHYHRMDWSLDPTVAFIQGVITTHLRPKTAGVDHIIFDCSSNLTVDSVKLDGLSVNFTQIGDGLDIELPQSMALNTTYVTEVWYKGNPQSSGFGNFDIGVHGPNNDPVLWTLSQPYGAKEWWPCKQSLNDKIDSIDVYVLAPDIYTVGSNGLLIDELDLGQGKITHWKHKYPIPAYLIALGISNYLIYDEYAPLGPGDSIRVLNYVYPEEEFIARNATAEVKDFMAVFNNKFGLYPYAEEKYGHMQCGFGGGMEHTTMTSMGGWGFEIIAHELAHQWFGNKVTCKTWTDIWLNEGFATFLTGLCYEAIHPNTFYKIWNANQVGFVISQPDGSVRVDDTTSVPRVFDGRLTYTKGGMLLRMLRHILGDQDFFQGVYNYINDPAIAFGYAETGDLKFHLENASGKNLTYFFNDWYSGQGHPKYTVYWDQNGNGLVNLSLQQTPSHPSVSFFELPVPIGFYGQSQDTIINFPHTSNTQYFFAQLPFQVDSIVFNPEHWIVAELDTILLGTPGSAYAQKMEIYPNPVGENLFLKGVNEPVEIQIFDISGRMLQSSEFIPGSPLDTRALRSGVYFLHLYDKTFRFIKL